MNNYTNPVKTKRQGYLAGTYYGADRNLDSNSCNCNGKDGNSIEMLFTELELRDAGILEPDEAFNLSNLQENTAFSLYMYNKIGKNASNALGKVIKSPESDNTFAYVLTSYAYEVINSDSRIKGIIVETGNSQLAFYDPYIVSVNGVKAGGNLDLKGSEDVEILTEGLDLIPYSLEEGEDEGGGKKASDPNINVTDSGKSYNVEVIFRNQDNFTSVREITCGVRDDHKTLYYKQPLLDENPEKGGTKLLDSVDVSYSYVECVRVTLDTYVECIAYFNGATPSDLPSGQVFITPKQ